MIERGPVSRMLEKVESKKSVGKRSDREGWKRFAGEGPSEKVRQRRSEGEGSLEKARQRRSSEKVRQRRFTRESL